MKAFIIYLEQLPWSKELAERCILQADSFGLEVELFPGLFRDEGKKLAKKEGIPKIAYDYIEQFKFRKMRRGQWGCLMSHFSLWKKCIELNQNILILEQDAQMQKSLPEIDFKHVLNLQSNTWDDPEWPYYLACQQRYKDDTGYCCLPGASAYMITPAAARLLVKELVTAGPLPADIFVNKTTVEIVDNTTDTFKTYHDQSSV